MLKGFLVHPDGNIEIVETLEPVEEMWSRGRGAVWLDVDRPDREELARIGSLFRLDEDAIDDCLAGEQRQRVDDYDDYLFMVFYGAIASRENAEFAPRKCCMFYNTRFLITVHHEPVLAVREARRRVERSPDTMRRGIDHLFFLLIDGAVDNYVYCAETYEEVLEALEEESLRPHPRTDLVTDVSRVRRELIGFRHLVISLREAVTPFTRGDFHHISESLSWDFKHVLDHLTYTWELLDGLRELTQNIRQNHSDHVARRTADLMRTLTIFSAFLMPMTLITGIYGMNVLLWPGSNNPLSATFIFGCMFVTGVLMFIYFRKRHWI